ncbi:hypothetical protein GQX74_005303 [Glossina fuscipes]|nr:hypothetical protein GQX74_005303 [Glossina fuscipes]
MGIQSSHQNATIRPMLCFLALFIMLALGALSQHHDLLEMSRRLQGKNVEDFVAADLKIETFLKLVDTNLKRLSGRNEYFHQQATANITIKLNATDDIKNLQNER